MSNEEKILEMLSTLTVTVNGMQADLQEVKQRLGNVENRLDNVENRLINVETRLDNVENRLINVETRLDNVENRLINVETRLDNVEHRLDNVDSRLNNLEKNVENIKEKQIAFEEFITDNLFAKDGLIQYMDNKFNDLQAEFDVLNNRQHATDIQVAKLRRIK